ncbi:MAG: hypothetical protein RBR77_00225 [Thauera sp.]|jgi:glucan phosphoethanolaminetransferase (alkaline phosphatase superfamily)|nr:hypothetical protein [Thauera sp.]
MYEIWLTLNILYELGLQYLPLIIATTVLWAVLMLLAVRRPQRRWGQALRPAVLVALLVTVITFFITPGLTQSSFANMGYWVDWGNLFLYAAAFGAVGGALAWPLLAMRGR